jgi:hypothetical protein
MHRRRTLEKASDGHGITRGVSCANEHFVTFLGAWNGVAWYGVAWNGFFSTFRIVQRVCSI